MADLCLSDSELFKPHSEYDIFNPDILPKLYSYIGETVVSFRPLGRKSACRMEFADGFLYCWAREKELPPNLFEAIETIGGDHFLQWGIDDA